MPRCEICRTEYQGGTAFCPSCGAPLTALAARMRDSRRQPSGRPSDEPVVLPELEDAETEA